LTLLAVAKGKFPISIKGDGDSDAQVIGGPGGYWSMMKAICDDDPPQAGPQFSDVFNAFISSCLKKDPMERLSAKALLDAAFVANNRSLDYQSTVMSPYENQCSVPEQQFDYEAQILKLTGSIIEKSVSGAVNSNSPVEDSKNPSSMNIIYSIRLEHLDRVLEKLVNNIQDKKTFARAMSDQYMKDDVRSGGIITPEDLLSPLPRNAFSRKPFVNSNHEKKEDTIEQNFNQSSHKNVHFEKPETNQPSKVKKKPQLKLDISEINGEVDGEGNVMGDHNGEGNVIGDHDMGGLNLPKTSSYFAATHNKADDTCPNSIHSATPHAPSKVDYKSVIPRFGKNGIQKWKHLATQLHLPLPLVLIAVRSRIGNLIDLDEGM
jgi:serine/threonine protein kinase